MKNFHRLTVAFIAISVSPLSIAEDVSFTPRLTTGYMDYKLETPSVMDVFPSQKYNASAAVVGVGSTLSWNRLYLDVYGQVSAKSSDDLNLPAFNYNEKLDGDVKDFSLAAGVAITDNLSVYIGYKYNKLDASGNRGTESTFKADGYFVGASYGWSIQDLGTLAFNLAIADLDGETHNKMPSLTVPGFTIDFNEKSNAQGLSYGISWNSAIDEHWGYSVALDGHQYKFKDLVDKQIGAHPGEIQQDIFTVRISVSYLF